MTQLELQESLEELSTNDSLKWIFVGGKGGVGKTTTSCALAVQLAKRRESVLILSTDPAHNLGDAFSQKFSGSPVLVNGFTNLYAMELTPTPVENVEFTLADDSGLSKILPDLLASVPGIDEAIGFAELMQSVRTMKYSCIVFDTAPTGHTLRLLGFPAVLEKGLAQLASLKDSMAGGLKMMHMMSGSDFNEEELSYKLDSLRAITTSVKETFRDPTKTTFTCVCIPEFLSLYETERLVQELAKTGIDCSNIVVNQVLFPSGCEDLAYVVPPVSAVSLEEAANEGQISKKLKEENDSLREAIRILEKQAQSYGDAFISRRRMQTKYLRQIKGLYGEDFHVVCMPLLPEEVRGLTKLEAFANQLMTCKPLPILVE